MNFDMNGSQIQLQPLPYNLNFPKQKHSRATSTRIKIENHSQSVRVTHSNLAAFLELAYSKALKTEAYLW